MKRLLISVALLTLSRSALASGPVGIGGPIDSPPPPTHGLEPGNKRGYWSRGVHRPFVSSVIDAGYLYFRPGIAIGYGKPHWRFAQLEAIATVAAGGMGQSGGIRLSLPYVELRGGMRAQLPFSQSFLREKQSYTRFDLEDRDEASARYLAFDSDLSATIPAYRGSIFTLFGAHYVWGVTDGYDVYEQQTRIIARSPWIYRARVGYAFRLGEQGAIRIGPVADWLYNPGRRGTTIRGGIIATVVLSHHVEVLATFMPTILSPDTIGLAGADFGQLGIRYRWASPAPPRTSAETAEP